MTPKMRYPGTLAKSLSISLLALSALLLLVESVQAAVTLISFRAISQDGSVVLLWETATELDNAGFYINRSMQRDSGYQRINQDILVTRGDGVTGAKYEYLDENVVNGMTYWYRLEAIDLNQNSSFFEPVSAIPGPSPTVTLTITPTVGSGSGSTTTIIPPGSTLPAQQVTPQPPFATNPFPAPTTQTSVPLALDQADSTGLPGVIPGGPTSTLIPFPSITVLFPSTQTPTPIIGELELVEQDSVDGQTFTSLINRFWPAGLLILLWAIIALWFFFTHRQV